MDNIYGEGMFFPEEEKFFEAIEVALGFKLFVWQKTFITTGHFRRSGKTTAEILRELTRRDMPPIDFTRPAHSEREKLYREELLKIKRKLNENGIQTREVFTTKKEMGEWLNEARKKHADGFRASVFTADERSLKPWQK